MRIVSLRLYAVRIPFRFTYRHPLAERREAESVLVSVTTDSGVTGWGECIPRTYLTGETCATVLADLEARFWPDVRGRVFDGLGTALDVLAPVYDAADTARRTAAYAGLELACLDAIGRATGRPAREAVPADLRGADLPIRWSGPVGGGSQRVAAHLARVYRWLGFRDIKLKVGADDDLARIRRIRRILGSKFDLRVDANAAWDRATTVERSQQLSEEGVTSIEQPIPATDPDAWNGLQAACALPVMADESLCTRADASALIDANACAIFNLRLAKCGGFLGCLSQLRLARAAGLDCQLGALVGETSILSGAGQEFLAAIGPLRHAETSFPRIFLGADPAYGAATPVRGGETLPRRVRPGLGVTVRPSVVRRITTESRVLQ